MNKTAFGDKRPILVICLIVLAVAYHFARPVLQTQLGVSLPAIWDSNESTEKLEKSSVGLNSEKASGSFLTESSDTTNSGSTKTSTPSSTKFALKKIGGDDLQSPAGLIYGMGANRQHRVDHVMDHGTDNPSRPVQGVFNGDKDAILAMIDEAYKLVKEKSPAVKAVQSADDSRRMEYTIDMKRDIGYKGGQNGKRDGFPKLQRIKIVLEKNRVITAFPY